MSILNARSTEDELVIEVDSLGGLPPGLVGPESECASALVKVPKVCLVPHQQLVAAVRGTLAFYVHLTGALTISPHASPDDLIDGALEFLTETHRHFRAMAAVRPEHELGKWDHDGVIGIYSTRLRRIRSVSFHVSRDGEVTVHEMSASGLAEVHITPWFDELKPIEARALASGALISEAPAAQLRLVQQHTPEFMTGGDIVSVRLTRDAITSSVRAEPQWRS